MKDNNNWVGGKLLKEHYPTWGKYFSKYIEEYKYHQAGELLYQYFWHVFADKIIEESKDRFRSEKKSDQAAAQAVVMKILKESIKMLHPFMPYVTEAVWEKLPKEKGDRDLLMVEKW